MIVHLLVKGPYLLIFYQEQDLFRAVTAVRDPARELQWMAIIVGTDAVHCLLHLHSNEALETMVRIYYIFGIAISKFLHDNVFL